MKFYESQAVAEAGAEAIAQGNEIALAPGMADFSTRSGQERLGHEPAVRCGAGKRLPCQRFP